MGGLLSDAQGASGWGPLKEILSQPNQRTQDEGPRIQVCSGPVLSVTTRATPRDARGLFLPLKAHFKGLES